MRRIGRWGGAFALVLSLCVTGGAQSASTAGPSSVPNPLNTIDRTGVLSTYGKTGPIDPTSAFFQSLGSNGRSCATCHQPADAFSVTPSHLRERFEKTEGTDPVFRPVDGANCPSADVSSSQARKQAYSLLLNKGLIRISLPVPAGANFVITGIQDPYNCSQTTADLPAMHRRPLPATNLDFLSMIMWDGRETVAGAVPGKSIDLIRSLRNQAADALVVHAQATGPPNEQQLSDIVAFEESLYSAQVYDDAAHRLVANGALGGPVDLSTQKFYIGINDAFGDDPNGAPFNPEVFTLYNSWGSLTNQPNRQAVLMGQSLFNNLPIAITGVAGLNDLVKQPVVNGTCSTCHDTPNVGNHSFFFSLRVGTTDSPAVSALDISGLPVYTVQCANGHTVELTDPGRALVSGRCSDLGKVKVPILRGLAGRAPYFHNGSAATLDKVVEFYNQRFHLNLTDEEKFDLVAFLKTL